jgi:hypothetical protein
MWQAIAQGAAKILNLKPLTLLRLLGNYGGHAFAFCL